MQLPDRFETLPRDPAQAARRAAIERHFKAAKDQRNAGSDILTSRQPLYPELSLYRLFFTTPRRKFR